MHEGLTGYIGDMMNIDTGSLTSDDLERLLNDRGVSSEHTGRLRTTLELCDFIRFASAETSSEVQKNLLKDTRDIITILRNAL